MRLLPLLWLVACFPRAEDPAEGGPDADADTDTDTDTDTDADTDADTDTDTDTDPPGPAGLKAIDPADGPTGGGQEVRLYGEGFGDTTRVWFDDTRATSVTVISAEELAVKTPSHAAGPVDVAVGNGDLADDTVPGGYTYWTDRGGQLVAIGLVYNYEGVDDGSEAWAAAFYPLSPSTGHVYNRWVSALGGCEDGGLSYDWWGGEAAYTGGGGDIPLEATTDDSWADQAFVASGSGLLAANQPYTLELTGTDEIPDQRLASIASIPGAFTVSSPRLGVDSVDSDRSMTVSLTGGAEDYLYLRLLGYDWLGFQTDSAFCAGTDGGSFTVPASVMGRFAASSYLDVTVGRLRLGEATIVANDGRVEVAAMHIVAGTLYVDWW